MKKFALWLAVCVLILFLFVGCAKKTTAPKAGSATSEDMLRLFPEDTNATFFVDFHRAMNLEAIEKAIKEHENYQKYQEFIEKSGVDPQKDIYFICGAFLGDITKEEKNGAAIINLKYDKDQLLSLIKENVEKEEEPQESLFTIEEYVGFSIYSIGENEHEGSFSFLNDSNIVLGTSGGIKSVIDVLNNNKKGLFANKALASLLKNTNKEAIFWGAGILPQGVMDNISSKNPMLSNLSSISAGSIYFDYKNNNIIGEINLLTEDDTKNQQLADFITGIKAMGSMAAAQKPEISQLIDKIEISAGADYVKIFASIPEELATNLKEALKKEEK